MNVAVVEDDSDYSAYLCEVITSWGYVVQAAADGEQALQLLQTYNADVILTDLVMPKVDGFSLLRTLQARSRLPPTIVMTAFGSLEKALQVIHDLGGFWFIEKPVDSRKLSLLLSRAIAHGRLAADNEELRRQLTYQGVFGDLVGRTPQMQEVFALIRNVAPTSAPVLITGQSGTGKELVARSIHRNSRRASGPFIALNCAAIPETLIESELFGHEKGSFTGAVERRAGALENAKGGTLFLDEIGEMPIQMQPKLLRVLEEYAFRRIGGKHEIAADVRIVAATNRNTTEAVQQGALRQDLYYRLNVFEINLPPLRQRAADIPFLVDALIFSLNAKHGTQIAGAAESFLVPLQQHAWPGNVRELRNVVERAVILAGRGILAAEHIPLALRADGASSFAETGPHPASSVPVATGAPQLHLDLGISLDAAERALIEATLQQAGNNKTRAATILGVSTKTLHAKLKQYRLSTETSEPK